MEHNPHEGHRARVKREFLANGFSPETPPHKILELLLFFCLPQGDTNPLAHALLEKYSTLSGVLKAPVQELITFKGLTESNVVLLKLLLPIARRCLAEEETLVGCFGSIDELGDYILRRYIGIEEETISLVSLDGVGRLLGFEFLESGDLTSVGLSTRKLVETVLKNHATCAILAHNHPGGIALPSDADLAMTRIATNALSPIGVKLLDHIILAGNDYVSLVQSTQYRDLFDALPKIPF